MRTNKISEKDSIFERLHQRYSITSSDNRPYILETCEEFHQICSKAGGEGDTPAAEDAEDDVEVHFVCFAIPNNKLVLLDGDRKSGPYNVETDFDIHDELPTQTLFAVQQYIKNNAGPNGDLSALLALVDTSK